MFCRPKCPLSSTENLTAATGRKTKMQKAGIHRPFPGSSLEAQTLRIKPNLIAPKGKDKNISDGISIQFIQMALLNMAQASYVLINHRQECDDPVEN